ncbi:InlB B-repeat-containing protein [Pseudoramibacter alactolyticus]|uniref:InlB B-repeat-containing protein n=1 Tax=Pseudoramibacter alactolyticus TaxID=113287 RepID=UPI002356EEBD|nr:InlB B-repeat-containing protein [Pseudoramibacter alactolyticus]MBM6968130.1 InlB B-repeat-containing protein [Pseudoramibacter alactolyticus]
MKLKKKMAILAIVMIAVLALPQLAFAAEPAAPDSGAAQPAVEQSAPETPATPAVAPAPKNDTAVQPAAEKPKASAEAETPAAAPKKAPAVMTYTVKFDSRGGTPVPDQTVEHGKKAVKPADPTKEDHVFDGWYWCGRKFDFNMPITTNLKLTAHWKELKSVWIPVNLEVRQGGNVKPPARTFHVSVMSGGETITATGTAVATNGVGTYKGTVHLKVPEDIKKVHLSLAEKSGENWEVDDRSYAVDLTTEDLADIIWVNTYTKNEMIMHTIIFDLNGGVLEGKTGTLVFKMEDGTIMTILDAPTRRAIVSWGGKARGITPAIITR